MPLSNKLAKYSDIKTVLDAAIDAGLPAEYTLPTENAAIRWRQRAYHFRNLSSTKEYASIVLRLPRGSSTIVIEYEEIGTLTKGGEKVEVAEPQVKDEIETEAEKLARELGISI